MIRTMDMLQARLPPRLARWSSQLLAAELCYGVDPYTLAAIIDRESFGGELLAPKGAAGKGDNGHGHGLAQIDDRTHGKFLDATFPDGTRLWQDPAFNLLYGARLLWANLRATEGDSLLAITAYNCGLRTARWALANRLKESGEPARIAALDSVTNGGNYLSDVLKRRAKFLEERNG
jgi:hypothetical protein